MKQKIKFFLLLILILTLFRPIKSETTIHSSSLSHVDIQQAIDSANSGDTVVLPERINSNFGGTVYISKGIWVRGQGKTKTILQRSSPAPGMNPIFAIDGFNGEPWQVSKHILR